jgi:hypothetical protein
MLQARTITQITPIREVTSENSSHDEDKNCLYKAVLVDGSVITPCAARAWGFIQPNDKSVNMIPRKL